MDVCESRRELCFREEPTRQNFILDETNAGEESVTPFAKI